MINKNKKHFNLRGFLFIVFVFVFVKTALAQSGLNQILNTAQFNDFNIGLSNYRPYPQEEIAASVENANFDPARADIKWTLNGKTIKSGRGEDKANFNVGALGLEYVLSALVTTSDGAIIKKTLTLNPSDIDLLWQAETYTPYFYEGKALPSGTAKIKIGAAPHFVYRGQKIKTGNIFFKWFINGNLFQEGWGKDSVEFKTAAFSGTPNEIEVEASSETKIISQRKKTVIINEKPTIKLYEYDFVYRAKPEKSLVSFSASPGEKIKILAEPFFAPYDKLNNASYEWKINGQKTNVSPPFNILDFSSDLSSYGEAAASVKIKFANLFEEISKNFSINIR